jgi:hypothetical protein
LRTKGTELIIITVIMLGLSGCVNTPVMLNSPVNTQLGSTVTPSFAEQKGGLHPFAGLNAGIDMENGFTSKHFGANVGLLEQTSFEKEMGLGFFSTLSSKIEYSSISFNPPMDSLKSTRESDKNMFDAVKNSFTSDVALRAGPVLKFPICSLSAFGIGVAGYENGEYFDYRSALDDIGNYYNISINRFLFGYGLGCDIAMGNNGAWDFGVVFEMRKMFMHTQSYESTKSESIMYFFYPAGVRYTNTTVSGGVPLERLNIKTEIYMDYKKIRNSISFSGNDICFTCLYRW